jgi:hypothetical protein
MDKNTIERMDKFDKRLRVIEGWLLEYMIARQKEKEHVKAVLEKCKSESSI